MKQTTYLLIALIAGLLSCNKEDENLPLTPGLVTEIKAYDLGNDGNSSDIRMSFKVKDNLNVIEYRVMIIPFNALGSVDNEIAASTPLSAYTAVIPGSFQIEYSMNRLPANLNDITGNPVMNDQEYVVGVFVLGNGNTQLSTFSNPLKLKVVGIFSGRYGDEVNYIDLFSIEGINYSGTGMNKDPQSPVGQIRRYGTSSFVVLGNVISDYFYSWPEATTEGYTCPGESGGNVCGDVCCLTGDPCPETGSGEGIIMDELEIVIQFIKEDCMGTSEVTIEWIRQG